MESLDLSDNGLYHFTRYESKKNGSRWSIRRFVMRFPGGEGLVTELPPAEVEQERESALQHQYHKAIVETLRELHPEKPTYEEFYERQHRDKYGRDQQ